MVETRRGRCFGERIMRHARGQKACPSTSLLCEVRASPILTRSRGLSATMPDVCCTTPSSPHESGSVSRNRRYLCMPKKKSANAANKGAASVRNRTATPGSGRVEVVRVPKPWGHETIWAVSDRYVGKILHINAGHELSVQYHNKKDETAYLLSGEIVYRVQRNGEDELDDVRLEIGESFRIVPGTIHQMIAVTDCDVL